MDYKVFDAKIITFIYVIFFFILFSEGFRIDKRLSNKKSLSTAISCTNSKYNYRNAKISDIPNISKLCVECFDADPWYQVLSKSFKINKQIEQLNERFRQIENGYKHAMIVCYDGDNLIGFTEIGMLPRPSFLSNEESSTAQSQVVNIDHNATDRIAYNTTSLFSSIEKKANDAVYLGNVAVSINYRRMGIGGKLVQIGLKVSSKWKENDVFVVVDADNLAALRLYNRYGFQIVYDERESIYQSSKQRIFMRKILS